ncbi:PAS domain-containing sensor histidine kinase [Halorussus halophilus]|uniref:PAS domain-containing sensor histidine kinase n=1 Tax=Halorussus halophilus TaxID=2650975 RepID=UPI0017887B10|nr:PAS domain-containing sensor histidine kinase [Halorussus halophilus]
MSISDAAIGAGFDAFPSQVAILDATGRIVYTNRSWREFGANNGGSGESVGENYLSVCEATEDDNATVVADRIRSLLDDDEQVVAVEYPCHAPDRERWFTMRATKFDHANETYLLVTHVDITERKLSEQAVREQNDRLETVASVLSHDLRNPLNVALGRARMMESEHGEAVVRSLERMEDIVADALVLARDEDATNCGPVELRDQAERAWEHVETDDASLVVADSFTFEADSDLLGHVFENLFRNAIDHAGSGVTVTVGLLDNESGFFVADDGPGIPEDERETVFDHGYTTSSEGTGLGLAIVQQVVEAHDWTVSVDSGAEGAKFDVRT